MNRSDLAKYDYVLPPELIRKQGMEPRDSARLFVYDTATDTVTFDTFRNLAKYLPTESLVMFNDTKVLPARLWLKKETGGKIEVFVLMNEIEDARRIPVLVDRKIAAGQKLLFPDGNYFEVLSQKENIFFVQLLSAQNMNLEALLDKYGETPLPHYLEGAGTTEDVLRKRYQTVFAKDGASVAAPTASLHFTEEVFDSLQEKKIEIDFLTLNVGLGTFAPLSPENFETKKLHTESVDVSAETAEHINTAIQEKKKIVAVGTTTLRTLESLASTHQISPYQGKTDIFIYPPYEFQVVDILLTNFHLPKTSLMLLVDAFLRHKKAKKSIIDLYRIAIENEFAFYSFGDSMLIL
ncbi:MAG: tRNA preQ1(34) S-adenosylmethionine ribosyltransferase-isomerase QueA [Candidatus Moraniibacteriota bacterium]